METKASMMMLVVIACFLSMITIGIAQNLPTPPSDFSATGSSTFNDTNYALQTADALAGNITSLTIHAIGQTKTWQGYYGNITATITLDDVNNFTFYNWSAAEPRGQIYATLNATVVWNDVVCFDFVNTSAAYYLTMEDYYGVASDDPDGVNETYTTTGHPSFNVGSRTMTGCPTTYIFQSDTAQTANFPNVLLYDPNNAADGWIYTTLLENSTAGSTNDLLCYNGAECDFQILVNEDGHGTDTATTTYYFWVEIV